MFECPKCPKRFSKVRVGVNDLATVRAELAAQWHPTKNGDLAPESLTPKSRLNVWWLCPAGHEWMSVIRTRARFPSRSEHTQCRAEEPVARPV